MIGMGKNIFGLIALMICLATSLGCSPKLVEKGLPGEIKRSVRATKPRLIAEAVRTEGGGILIRMSRETEIKVARETVYKSILWQGKSRPYLEPIEYLLAPAMIPLLWVTIDSMVLFPETGDIKHYGNTRLQVITAPLSPLTTLLGTTVERDYCISDRVFSDPAVWFTFKQTVSRPDLPVTYRVFSDRGAEIESGMTVTDPSGEITLNFLKFTPARVELRAPGINLNLTLSEQSM